MKIQDLNKFLSCTLRFSTLDGQFEGKLEFINLKEEQVTFEHTYCLPSRIYVGTINFKFKNFLSYNVLDNSTKTVDTSKSSDFGELHPGDDGTDEAAVLDGMKVACPKDLPSHLKILCPDHYCIIDSISPKFFHSIREISLRDSCIGLSLHGPEISRTGSLSWLCTATSQCVFMFDIGKIKGEAFHRGLRRIMEDESIEKVVYDGREPADCLEHLFQTNLQNVFDCKIADNLINLQSIDKGVSKYVSSLDSCLVKYLKLPEQFLFNRNKCLSRAYATEFHKRRPVDEDFIQVLLKSTIYLLALKDKQEELLIPPDGNTDLYYHILRNATEDEKNYLMNLI